MTSKGGDVSKEYGAAYEAAGKPSRSLVAALIEEKRKGDGATDILAAEPRLHPLSVAIDDFTARLGLTLDDLGIDARYSEPYRDEVRATLKRVSQVGNLKVSPTLAQDIKGKMLPTFLDALCDRIPVENLANISKVTFTTLGKEDENLVCHVVEVEAEYSDGKEATSYVTYLTVDRH